MPSYPDPDADWTIVNTLRINELHFHELTEAKEGVHLILHGG